MKKKNDLVYDIRDIVSIRDIVEGSFSEYPDNTAFLWHTKEGIKEVNFSQVHEDILSLASYFASVGLENKKIGLIGKNSYNWALTYLTVTAGVGIIVPFDKELKEDELKYLVSDSEITAIVYSDECAAKCEELPEDIIRLPMSSFEEYKERGKSLRGLGYKSYEEHKVDPYALGVLIYTSGTTGVAKGVMLSQYNICSDIMHVTRKVRIYEEDRVLSVLPLHHTYACMADFLSIFYAGASIAYNESLRYLQSDFKEFHPTVLVAVPVILEKLRDKILKNYEKIFMGKTVLSIQRTLSSVFANGNDKQARKIFSSVSAAFGGRLRAVLCGAASLPADVFEDFRKFGITVYVGYGLTETSPVCIMHNDFYQNSEDIGYPITGVKVKIIDENDDGIGELLVKGSNVMLGYYKNPEETAKVMLDGYFCTGDLARRNPNGSYTIVGRRKSMIVTSNGKKIFPEEVEYYLSKNKFVAECLVFGEEQNGKTVVCASVFPNYDEVNARLSEDGITPESENYAEEVRKLISDAVKEVNEKLPSFKAVHSLKIRKKDFEKTTTRKIKRHVKENLTEGDEVSEENNSDKENNK
ncbi:MAG: AMP-dependent synthetase/ligase [Eubacteriales bacterium]